MNFDDFSKAIDAHFTTMTKSSNLFTVDVDKDELWNTYLDSFPTGTNETYNSKREYDCHCCRNFIKNIGNVVAIENGKMISLWDMNFEDEVFTPVIKSLSQFIHSHEVTDIFIVSNGYTCNPYTRSRSRSNESVIDTWTHLHAHIPNTYACSDSKTRNEKIGVARDSRNVFKRSLDEITTESVKTVLELIYQNSLYRGKEFESILKTFLKYKKAYDKLETKGEKDLFAWEYFSKSGTAIARIRNHAIGTLLTDVSIGVDLEEAVRKFEAMVAPVNYKRPKPIFTQKMLEEAKEAVEKLGYMDALKRRFATLDDITVNNILFSNKDAAKRIKGSDVFSELMDSLPVNPKKFDRVEEIGIENFIQNVLPTVKSIEAFVENKHASNFVSLIAPETQNGKTMFKWDNNFSWSYTGNIADSNIKQNVKSAGGKIDGVLRFSIQWNSGTKYDPNDLDAHCKEPNGNHIWFSNKYDGRTTGELDIDIIEPKPNVPAVENITWSNLSKMPEGIYKFYVNNFTNRGGKEGFVAEIEFDGQIYNFEYPKEVKQDEDIVVAEVTLKDGKFSIKECLSSQQSSKKLWNINTNQFIPVSVMMYSPNYWNEQSGIGNKHYFFMLTDCVNEENPHGFYNEFLDNSLDKHRKVFEALGSKMSVADTEDQLSGLGFSSTIRNELIVKVTGTTERILKIKF